MDDLIANPKEIHLHDSDKIDQILGAPAGWVLRWGLSLLFATTMIFGLLAWWIKYPDVIPAQVVLVTDNPVIRVFVPVGGKIDKLLAEDNSFVEKNKILAVLENPTKTEDVETLESFLKKVENGIHFPSFDLPDALSLGNMQNGYAALILKMKNYRQFSNQTGTTEKINSIENRIENIQKLNSNISKQKSTLQEEIALVKRDYERNLRLNEVGELSISELEKSKAEYLQARRLTEDFDNQILNNNVNISALETQIIDLKEERSTNLLNKELVIQENIYRLKNEIETWKQTYLIVAPQSGKTSFSKNWSAQQFINQNEELMAIVPTGDSHEIIGRALLPIAASGKVEVGQTANVQLSSFPFREFGILKSTVTSISGVPKEGSYLVELELQNGLKTTYDKTIPFRQEMQGTANIITEKRRVVTRIFDKILSILKNT